MKNRYGNRFAFGIGTIGRDMVYALISMFLMFYLTEILELPNKTLWWIGFIMMGARIFDALNDPVMGVIVDNTKSRFGKFKPWIALGVFLSGLFTVALFTDTGLRGTEFIILFSVLYLCWGISYTINDISYWSMLPSLSINQKEREKIGAFARICANLGLFAVVVGIVPITEMLRDMLGSMTAAYFAFAVIVIIFMWLGQSITLLFVKEPRGAFKQEPPTTLRGMFSAIAKNDQLMVTAVSMALFMTGYVTTTSFGLYFFKYAFGNEGMFSAFAGILGVSQILALAVFPVFSKWFSRKKLYTISILMVVIGYIIFFVSPMNIIPIGIAGLLIFFGQAFIQLLMLMFLADSVEYGQWKLGKRNESVTFSIQPFINKMGGAIATGVVSVTLIISGINDAKIAADVTAEGLLIMKAAMLIFPLLCIAAGYLIYIYKYKIDKKFFAQIIADLDKRGDIERNKAE